MVAFGIAQKGNFFERKNCPIARRIKGLDWGHVFSLYMWYTCDSNLPYFVRPRAMFIVASDMKEFKKVTKFKYFST